MATAENQSSILRDIFYLPEDPRTKEWPLINSPMGVLALLLFYLVFVTKAGPAWMKNRKPFILKEFIFAYNVVQIVACASLVLFSIIPLQRHNWICFNYEFLESDMVYARLAFCFFILKIVDLIDTVVFVLRKKNNQVTFLHVFHHIYVVAFGYLMTRYIVSTYCALLTILNCTVHTFMYYYYLKSSISDKPIWWKKYLTTMQIGHLSFMTLAMMPTMLTPSCAFPKLPIFYAMFLPIALLILLFRRFYAGAYKKEAHAQHTKAH